MSPSRTARRSFVVLLVALVLLQTVAGAGVATPTRSSPLAQQEETTVSPTAENGSTTAATTTTETTTAETTGGTTVETTTTAETTSESTTTESTTTEETPTTTTSTATPTPTPTTTPTTTGTTTTASGPETSSYSYDTADSFVVEQGDQCIPVTPLSGDRGAKGFYDYRNPYNRFGTDYSYSSHMPGQLTEPATSRLFLYDGPNGVSLVIVHNEIDADTDGAATFAFEGLPQRGEWLVVDDDYPGQDDQVSRTKIDWTWRGDRTDGGVFRGVDRSDLNVTIRPTFGEGAALYASSDRAGHIDEWQVLSGGLSDPTVTALESKSEPVTIRSGTCGGTSDEDANPQPTTDEPATDGTTTDTTESASEQGESATDGADDERSGDRSGADGAATESDPSLSDGQPLETEVGGPGGESGRSPLGLDTTTILFILGGTFVGVAAVLYAISSLD